MVANGTNLLPIFVETERLILRVISAQDACDLIDLDSDPEVMRYLTDGEPTEPQIIYEKALPRMTRFNKATKSYEYFAAVEKATGEFIGWFHFRPPFDLSAAEPGEMELGYRLKRRAWGMGYATEASKAIIRKGFLSMNVQVVSARAMAANKASIRVMEKVGLEFHSHFTEEKFPGQDKRAVKFLLKKDAFLENQI